MQVARDTVVSLRYELSDAQGELIERADANFAYLHGGHDGIFGKVEQALEGQQAGFSCRVRLEPEDAFGEYDAELVRVEPRAAFPETLAVGMRFEGTSEQTGETLVYTVTDIAGDRVVVDANHPLAGKTLVFACTVTTVRAAMPEELAHGHVHGPHGHHH